jgi:hypothetical protein
VDGSLVFLAPLRWYINAVLVHVILRDTASAASRDVNMYTQQGFLGVDPSGYHVIKVGDGLSEAYSAFHAKGGGPGDGNSRPMFPGRRSLNAAHPRGLIHRKSWRLDTKFVEEKE